MKPFSTGTDFTGTPEQKIVSSKEGLKEKTLKRKNGYRKMQNTCERTLQGGKKWLRQE